MILREHIYQKALHTWAREYVREPKQFLSFDRAKPGGKFSHAREKARGVKAGTPDTMLRVPDIPAIWWECKAVGQRPDEQQGQMGRHLVSLGDHWGWGTTVVAYAEWLWLLGVPLLDGWKAAAERADASVLAMIEAAEMRKGKLPSRIREAKPSAARLRKIAKLRSQVPF